MLQYSQPGPSARSYCASLAFARSRVLLACGVNRLPGSVTNTPPDWTTSVLAVTNAHDESTSCAISFTTRHCSIVLMDRASRFIWDLSCGERDRTLFEQALQTLAQVVQQTHDLALVTDGERRYGLVLFEICQTVIRTGQRGRPRHTLPEGVQVRVKNKGSQAHRRGRKRPKYQAPQPEHPKTTTTIAEQEIHANHVEAFNAALHRRLACYRRKTNTYAKKRTAPMSAGCLLALA